MRKSGKQKFAINYILIFIVFKIRDARLPWSWWCLGLRCGWMLLLLLPLKQFRKKLKILCFFLKQKSRLHVENEYFIMSFKYNVLSMNVSLFTYINLNMEFSKLCGHLPLPRTAACRCHWRSKRFETWPFQLVLKMFKQLQITKYNLLNE